MSATLVLKIAAPIFAFAVSGLIWAVAGPLPAGLSLVTFLLGVVTSELDHMRWKTVEEPTADASSDSALMALLEAGGQGAAAPAQAQPPPRHYYRCTRHSLAIGSGRRRAALVERSRRQTPPTLVPEPLSEAERQALEDEIFAAPAPALAAAISPGMQPEAEPEENAASAAGARPPLRAEPPPPKVTILRPSYPERAVRR